MRHRPAFQREIEILYEDDAILAVDKPAGLPAVPIAGSKSASAFGIVAVEMKRRRERAFVVHRIDRFTSGILLFAKTNRSRDALVRQFLKHTPQREYLAVVRTVSSVAALSARRIPSSWPPILSMAARERRLRTSVCRATRYTFQTSKA